VKPKTSDEDFHNEAMVHHAKDSAEGKEAEGKISRKTFVI
jgi:hypothetical protein